MVPAVSKLATHELRLADRTLKCYQPSPYFPVDVFPFYVLLVVHVLNKSVEVEEPICNMLCDYLSMEVDEDLCVGTHHLLVLLVSVELPAVDAPIQKGGPLILAIVDINGCCASAAA